MWGEIEVLKRSTWYRQGVNNRWISFRPTSEGTAFIRLISPLNQAPIT